MNSACRGLDEEEGGNAGRRKLHGLGVSDVLRMSGRWLRRLRLRFWWLVAKEAKKKKKDNRRGYREEREIDGGSWWSVGGCVGFLWWS